MKKDPAKQEKIPQLVEGVDFYFEDGLMVLTEKFLRDRGYCCGNGCRHCPYPLSIAESRNAEAAQEQQNRHN